MNATNWRLGKYRVDANDAGAKLENRDDGDGGGRETGNRDP